MSEFDLDAMRLSKEEVAELTEDITGTRADVEAVDLPSAVRRFNLALVGKIGRERAAEVWQQILMHDLEGAAEMLHDEIGAITSTEPPDPSEPGVVRVMKRRGRPALAAGKYLVAVTDKNPHLASVPGFKSLELLWSTPERRMSYEDYRAFGGTAADLAWAVKNGHVQLVDPAGGALLNQPGTIVVSGS
jgi:hypothetical protein